MLRHRLGQPYISGDTGLESQAHGTESTFYPVSETAYGEILLTLFFSQSHAFGGLVHDAVAKSSGFQRFPIGLGYIPLVRQCDCSSRQAGLVDHINEMGHVALVGTGRHVRHDQPVGVR